MTVPNNSRPRCLFITAVDPQQLQSGGGAAARSILQMLAAPPLGAHVEMCLLRERKAILPHSGRQLVALARALFSSLSSKALFHLPYGAEQRVLRRAQAVDWDLIVINAGELFFLAEQLPPGIPRLGIAHNVEARLFDEFTRGFQELPLLGSVFRRDVQKFRDEEGRGARALGNLVTLSTEDEAEFRRLIPGLQATTIPTCFDYVRMNRTAPSLKDGPVRLGFLGKMTWQPNTDAIEWLLEHVWPRLPAGDLELHLYGQGSERFAGRGDGVVAHGFVADLNDVWRNIHIMVCPMVSGSGINIKFIEAIYNRMPVIATRFAARGLPAFSDPAVVYLDTPESWVEYLTSPQVDRLARQAPAAEAVAVFSVPENAARLADFVNRRVVSDVTSPSVDA